MQILMKREINFTISYISIAMLVTFGFVSCYNDNSDQIVQQTTAIKQFELGNLIETLSLDNTNLKESVVGVEGIIEDINFLNDRKTIILRGKENTDVLLICDMQENQATLLKSLEIGELIKIKGILKGSLKDIILLNCMINNKATK